MMRQTVCNLILARARIRSIFYTSVVRTKAFKAGFTSYMKTVYWYIYASLPPTQHNDTLAWTVEPQRVRFGIQRVNCRVTIRQVPWPSRLFILPLYASSSENMKQLTDINDWASYNLGSIFQRRTKMKHEVQTTNKRKRLKEINMR